ncbi:MAG: ABC transporter ATP-binding protein [Myxococcota bacterium]
MLLGAASVAVGYDERPIVSDVSLEIRPGDALAILGANGAGKTTLLRALAGIMPVLAGEVTLDGRPIRAHRRPAIARRLAYVPQEMTLLFPFRVIDVVLMGRYPHRRLGALETTDDLRAAREALERTDLLALRDRPMSELSGGERRRALLAQALCQEPAIVLLDEPTASLDVAHAAAFHAALAAERARRGLAVVVATHDLGAAARWIDSTVLLHGGAVAARGPTLEVLASEAAQRAFGVALHVGRVPETLSPFCVPR